MQKIFYLPNLGLFLTALLFSFSAALAEEAFSDFTQSIDAVVNDYTYEYYGKGTTSFVNTSGDTLHQLFYHAYFNAFSHGSALAVYSDIHGATATAERIPKLEAEQQGLLGIDSCTANGQRATAERKGTIIRIDLPHPLPPGERAEIAFSFSGRIPWIVRRAGRNNGQNIRYSMAQWYPKLCQYDEHGWHNDEYLLREFYGVFGTYDVRITLPARYIVGATGALQNPDKVGHGYQYTRDTTVLPAPSQLIPKDSVLTWHFRAEKVHDFAWVADENYAHTIAVHDSCVLHILHDVLLVNEWKPVADWCKRTLALCSERYGAYPYSTFTCAQAGDGGMEYPQLIMIPHREPYTLLQVVVHEIAHQWFYGLVASNETKHAWMDEGFTSYAEYRIVEEDFPEVQPPAKSFLQRMLVPKRPYVTETTNTYFNVLRTGMDEPLSTPHDRFADYGVSWIVYDKGMAFLRQLEYSFGRKALDSCLKRYALMWRYDHPYPRDFEKVCEEVFGQRMDEVFDTFIARTSLPDYSIASISSADSSGVYTTTIELEKDGIAHTPLAVYARLASGKWIVQRIPSDISYSPNDTLPEPWLWTFPTYTLAIKTAEEVEEVRLDTTHTLLDITAENNTARNRLLFPYLPPVRIGLWQRYDQAAPIDYYGISVRPSLWHFAPRNWQVGIRADGLIDFDRYRTTAGVYVNSESGKVDWQAAFSHPFIFGPLSSYSIRAWSMDDTRHADISISTHLRQRYSAPEWWTLTATTDYWAFAPASHRESEFYRISASALYNWQLGSLFLKAVAAGNTRAGAQATATLRLKPTAGSLLHLRFFATAATPFLPVEQQYSLHTTTQITQFENVPYRFVRGAASSVRSLFLPGGGAFTEQVGPPMHTILSLHMALREWYLFRSSGVPPLFVWDYIEAGAYGSAALAGNDESMVRKPADALYLEAGVLLSLNLNTIAPSAQLLWMFTDEPVLTLFVPVVRSIPGNDALLFPGGIRVGLGTAL